MATRNDNQPMVQKALESIETGMHLGADVEGAKGNILLRAGTCLTTRHLALLAANGIKTVQIQTEAVKNVGPTLTEAELDAHVEARFCLNDNTEPLISELMHLCRQRLNPAGTGDDADDS